MAVNPKNTNLRMYITAFVIFTIAALVLIKLNNIQWVEGDYYRKLAKERTVQDFVIPANKGNVYSADGSLLATSIPEYTIRFDALAPTLETFNQNIKPLSDSLAKMFGKTSGFYQQELQKARNNRSRYF
ncbi:MAG: hypothetical protein R2808_04330 [Flavobacterium sp.]